jgi:hypothetical protein
MLVTAPHFRGVLSRFELNLTIQREKRNGVRSWNDLALPEIGENIQKHGFGIGIIMETESACFGAIGEHVVVPGEHQIAETPGGDVPVRIRIKPILGDHRVPDRFFIGNNQAAENAFLLRAWEGLGFEIRTRIFLASKQFDIAKLHEPIVEAFERGDGKLAARLLREHSLGFAAQVGTHRKSSLPEARMK